MPSQSRPEAQGGNVCTPDLSFVLVNYNGGRYLEMCLCSLYDAHLRRSFEVVIVDNASSDGSKEMLRDRFPGVRLIENESNQGFARATNQGVEAAMGRFVLLLNTDTLVDGHALNAMVEFMDGAEDAGAAGGRLLNADGSFQGGHARFSSIFQEVLIASGLGRAVRPGYPSHSDASGIVQVDWVSAACLIVRRDVFLQLDGFDVDYFMYSEEVDFQFRLKREGWAVYYLPHVQTIHFGGISSHRYQRRRSVYRGKILFYRKNYGRRRELALRILLGIISLSKLMAWGLASVVPPWLKRAGGEWRSNWEVLALCARFE